MNILLSAMLSHADPSQVAGLARFFKTGPGQYGFGDQFLGIKVPVTREAGRRNKARLEAWLLPRFRTMPRTALRYAIEKFPEAERQQYLRK